MHRAVENAASDAAIIEDHIAVERAVFNRALAGDGVVERTAADGAAGVVGHGSLEGPAGDKAQGQLAVTVFQRIAILVQRFLIDQVAGEGPVFNDCAVVGHSALEGAAGDLALTQVSVATRVIPETGFIRHRTGERAAGDGGRLLICHIAGKAAPADGAVVIDCAGEAGALGIGIRLNGAAGVVCRAAQVRGAVHDLAAVGVHCGTVSEVHAAADAVPPNTALFCVAVGNGAAVHGKDGLIGDAYTAAEAVIMTIRNDGAAADLRAGVHGEGGTGGMIGVDIHAAAIKLVCSAVAHGSAADDAGRAAAAAQGEGGSNGDMHAAALVRRAAHDAAAEQFCRRVSLNEKAAAAAAVGRIRFPLVAGNNTAEDLVSRGCVRVPCPQTAVFIHREIMRFVGVAVHNGQIAPIIDAYHILTFALSVQHKAVQVQGDVFPDRQIIGQVDVAGEPDVVVVDLNGGLQSGLVRDIRGVFRRAGGEPQCQMQGTFLLDIVV